MPAFYAEIQNIQEKLKLLNEKISEISEEHLRSLGALDDEAAKRNADQLEESVSNSRALIDDLKARIDNLRKQEGGDKTDRKIRAEQTAVVARRFVEYIQRYQQVEKQYRDHCRDRVKRQLKIVNPNATQEEIEAAANQHENQQVFAQALQTSTRYGESRAAFKEVQERYNDIKRIENQLAELAQLFNDMSILVAQQDETIKEIEHSAEQTEQRTHHAVEDTKIAVFHAIRARKLRWICFFICVCIALAIALAVGLGIGLKPH
ncbi:hypothetical protein M422DRAFT_181831 [Sphaerobolus stellatus SS14]|uniref:t-SNARE coiled-coil homology domain-containing protein n=1 Tax=Sphaerobolus stellatus (strain SS14) TaxID=990650 RepID=A0A0C9UZE9_SPHS4|nr:hypothetical protein M422DRAFT_181831 [Sphaerobolus stellatus SS14]